MKLTVEDVARMNNLSVSTVRQYSWRMKVGTKKGTRKYFTREEAKMIGAGGQSKSKPKAKAASSKKKAKPVRKPASKKARR